jgi:hypothetical protein
MGLDAAHGAPSVAICTGVRTDFSAVTPEHSGYCQWESVGVMNAKWCRPGIGRN